jgi:hypothetical protein
MLLPSHFDSLETCCLFFLLERSPYLFLIKKKSQRIINTALIDQSTILSVSRTLLQYHPRAPAHNLQATSDSTIHHDRAHNNGCDSHRGVLPCDRHSQMGPETLEAASCRRWQ